MTSDQEKMLKDVHEALVGNDLGQEGLVKRMTKQEKKTENLERKVLLYSSFGSGIILTFKFLLSKFI